MNIESLNSNIDGGGIYSKGGTNIDVQHTRGCGKCSPSLQLTKYSQSQPVSRKNALGLLDLPIVGNDILIFRDGQQLVQYIDFISSLISSPSEGRLNMSEDVNSILEGVEQKLGFISLRAITEEAFEKLNEVGWDKLEDIPEKHFIPDASLLSVLNRYADVQIGDKISHFVNKHYAVTFDAENTQMLNMVHALSESSTYEVINGLRSNTAGHFSIEPVFNAELPKQGTSGHNRGDIRNSQQLTAPSKSSFANMLNFSQAVVSGSDGRTSFRQTTYNSNLEQVEISSARYLFTGALNGSDAVFDDSWGAADGNVADDLLGGGRIRPTIKGGEGKVTGGDCEIVVSGFHTDTDPCGVSETHVEGELDLYRTAFYTSVGVFAPRFHVFWGDGTENWYTGASTDIYALVAHTYSSPGVYTVKVDGYNDTPGISSTPCATKTFVMNVPNTCFHGVGGNRINVWAYRSDGYRAIRCSNWVKFWHPFGAPPITKKVQTGAKTEAFHWEKNFWGHWTWRKYHKAKRLIAEYTIDWTMDDIACSPWYTDAASTWPWGVQTAEVNQTGDGPRSWQKLVSHHEMWTDDGWDPIKLDLVAHPCHT